MVCGFWRRLPLRQTRSWRRGSLIVISSLLVWSTQRVLSEPSYAQTVTQATITEIVDGNQVYIQGRRARVNSIARQQQQVRTGRSRASLRFNTGVIARLARNSSLVVGQCAQLQQGTLLVNGRLNTCTGSSIAGVRGTIYTFSVDEAGVETLTVFEGEVEILHTVHQHEGAPGEAPEEASGEASDRLPTAGEGPVPALWGRPPATPVISDHEAITTTTEPVILAAGQSLMYNPASQEGVIEALTTEDFENLLRGPLVADFGEDLPGLIDLQNTFEQLFPDSPFPDLSLPTPAIPPPLVLPLPVPSPF